MCTARTKLKEVEQEMDCLYAELRSAKNDLSQTLKEKAYAEFETQMIRNSNMRLTKNADIANLWMMLGAATSFILLGLAVHCL